MKKIYLLFSFFSVCFFVNGQVPQFNVSIYDTTTTGYYFLTPFPSSFQHSYHLVLDAKGNVIYYKYFPFSLSIDFKVQDNTMITYAARGKFFLMDSTFIPQDSIIAANGYQTDFHDLQILPNGHYLLLATENVTMDLSGYNYFHHNGTAGSTNATVVCGIIQELDQNKNLVYEWHLRDHISFDSVDPFWLNDSAFVDWNHTNAIELDNDGNFLISSRCLNEITKINRTTGNVIWRLGGNYNQFTFLNDTVRFYGQHDIRRLSNGNITLFDDGWHTVSHGARALEYHLDETNMTAELEWSYIFDSTRLSYSMGSNQRIANSNRVIDYGVAGTVNNTCFNVVHADNSKVFELTFKDTLYSYRAFAYPSLPWSFHRPQIACYNTAGLYYLDAGTGYPSYKWSNGSTTQSIVVTSTDTFSVFVPCGQGGFISSEKFIVSDINNPCALISVNETSNNPYVKLFPNPTTGDFILSLSVNGNMGVLEIYSTLGEKVYSSVINTKNQTQNRKLGPGIYFVKVSDGESVVVQKLVVE